MKFLCQTINNKVVHDFVFQLAESVNYLNWWNQKEDFATIQYCELDDEMPIGFVPVGTVEFVEKYLKVHYNKTVKPINVPESLMLLRFTQRRIFNGTEKDIGIGDNFVKSNDRIKGFSEAFCKVAPEGNYQISAMIDIESEYRCFVYQKRLVGIQNYSGNFEIFPNVEKIKEMIRAYENAPVAYTLDVGVNKHDTFVIEVHDFFSCGLYGFSDNRIYAKMLYSWFMNFINS